MKQTESKSLRWLSWLVFYKPSSPRPFFSFPSSAGPFAEKSREFYLNEYECLREEIDDLSKESQTVKRETILTIGATIVWLFERSDKVPSWTWFIPLVFVTLGYSRIRGIAASFEGFAIYVAKIEELFYSPGEPGGWEHFISTNPWSREGFISFWRIMAFATGALGIYGFVHFSK